MVLVNVLGMPRWNKWLWPWPSRGELIEIGDGMGWDGGNRKIKDLNCWLAVPIRIWFRDEKCEMLGMPRWNKWSWLWHSRGELRGWDGGDRKDKNKRNIGRGWQSAYS